MIRYFIDKGARHTVFKMGGEGSCIGWVENGSVKEIRIPTYQVPVVDSTGCGDSYCAGFIVGLSMGWDLEQAGRLGSAAGALVVQGLGSDAGHRGPREDHRIHEDRQDGPDDRLARVA